MITFKKENNYFILVYIPDGDIQFLKDKFSANEVSSEDLRIQFQCLIYQ